MDKICIIGLWHQGIVAATGFADLGCDVTAADSNAAAVAALADGKAPIFEPGLDDLLQKSIRTGRLRFTTGLREAVRGREYVLIMFDIPVNADDQSDLRGLFAAVKEIAPALENDCVILVTAQVPAGTCREIENEIKKTNPRLAFAIAYSPENLQLGQAIKCFYNPALRVLGSENQRALDRLESLLAVIPGGKWERVSLPTAEMLKHALNGFLALSITFGNELGNLCDKTGADGGKLAQILRNDPRIGVKAMLYPGLGFSGGTLARDTQSLRNLGRQFGVATPMLDGLWQSNVLQNQIVILKLRQVLGPLPGRKITVLGLTYKPETSTLRRSISLAIIADLARAQAEVAAHDPKADREEIDRALGALAPPGGIRFEEDVFQAVRGAEALLLITGWKDYKQLDYGRIRKSMAGNLILDANNILNRAELERLGFRYIGIGRGYDAKI